MADTPQTESKEKIKSQSAGVGEELKKLDTDDSQLAGHCNATEKVDSKPHRIAKRSILDTRRRERDINGDPIEDTPDSTKDTVEEVMLPPKRINDCNNAIDVPTRRSGPLDLNNEEITEFFH